MSQSTARELRQMHEQNIKALEEHNAILQDIKSIKFGIFKINDGNIPDTIAKMRVDQIANKYIISKEIENLVVLCRANYVNLSKEIAHARLDIQESHNEVMAELKYINRKRWWQVWR